MMHGSGDVANVRCAARWPRVHYARAALGAGEAQGPDVFRSLMGPAGSNCGVVPVAPTNSIPLTSCGYGREVRTLPHRRLLARASQPQEGRVVAEPRHVVDVRVARVRLELLADANELLERRNCRQVVLLLARGHRRGGVADLHRLGLEAADLLGRLCRSTYRQSV